MEGDSTPSRVKPISPKKKQAHIQASSNTSTLGSNLKKLHLQSTKVYESDREQAAAGHQSTYSSDGGAYFDADSGSASDDDVIGLQNDGR